STKFTVPSGATWTHVNEYVYNNPIRNPHVPPNTGYTNFSSYENDLDSFYILNGVVGSNSTVPISNVVVSSAPPPANIVSRHLPANGFPTFNMDPSDAP